MATEYWPKVALIIDGHIIANRGNHEFWLSALWACDYTHTIITNSLRKQSTHLSPSYTLLSYAHFTVHAAHLLGHIHSLSPHWIAAQLSAHHHGILSVHLSSTALHKWSSPCNHQSSLAHIISTKQPQLCKDIDNRTLRAFRDQLTWWGWRWHGSRSWCWSSVGYKFTLSTADSYSVRCTVSLTSCPWLQANTEVSLESKAIKTKCNIAIY